MKRRRTPATGTRPRFRPLPPPTNPGVLFGVANFSGHVVMTTFDEPTAVRKASVFHGAVVAMPLRADFRLLPLAATPGVPDAPARRTSVCHCLRSIWWSENANGFAAWVHLVGGSPICPTGQTAAPVGVAEVRS